MIKNFLLFLTIPVSVISIGAVILTKAQNPTIEYKTHQDMANDSLNIPLREAMPISAVRIEALRNLDTGIVRASFEYKTGDSTKTKAVCKLIAESKYGAKFLCPPYSKFTNILILFSDGKAEFFSYPGGV